MITTMDNYYVIMVDNYDEENSGANILDNKIFNDRCIATAYLQSKIESIKQDHWVGDQDPSDEDFKVDDCVYNSGTYTAENSMTGQRLEAYIVELEP